MTQDEFQIEYHNYAPKDEAEALAECDKVNAKADGFEVVVVNFHDLGYCLMLAEAAEEIRSIFPEII